MASEDLEKLFADLCFIHDRPAVFIDNYFFEIQILIDVDAEGLLYQFSQQINQKRKDQEKAKKINQLREELLKILKEFKLEIVRELQTPLESERSIQVYDSLRQRIDQLITRRDENINEYEEGYARLAFELYEEMNRLEKILFKNRTITYIGTTRPGELGYLFYVPDCHLNMDEINYIRSQISLCSSSDQKEKNRKRMDLEVVHKVS